MADEPARVLPFLPKQKPKPVQPELAKPTGALTISVTVTRPDKSDGS